MQTKQEIRRRVKGLKQAATEQELSAASGAIVERIACSRDFLEASVVLLYAPLPDEPDVWPLLRRFSADKTLLLPTIVDGRIVLRVYEGEERLRRGTFNISEPTGTAFTDYATIDLAIIPGVAFDTMGHRLGRGGGYYDRLLSHPAFFAVKKTGTCFSFQMMEAIPSEAHDIVMDNVICD